MIDTLKRWNEIAEKGAEHALAAPFSSPRWRQWTLLALLGFFLCFFGLHLLDFTDLDEGFYASISFNMAKTGDWVTPVFNGEDWWEKPPLLYWKMAGAFRIFGYHEWAGRLPSAGAIFLTALITVVFANRWFDKKTAFFSGLTLITSLFFVVQAHLATTDGLLTLFLTFSFCCFYEFAQGKGKKWLFAASFACALGTLTKGPIALVFLLSLAILIRLRLPETVSAMNQKREWLLAAALYLLVIAPWYAGVLRQHGGEFLVSFLYEQNIGRFLGGDEAHNLPFWGGVMYLTLGFLPWSFYLIPAAILERGERHDRFLWGWFLLILGFFSISSAKLPNYYLPAYPAGAILVGRLFASERWREAKSVLWTHRAIAGFFVLLFLASFAPLRLEATFPPLEAKQATLALRFLMFTAGSALLWLIWKRETSNTPSALAAFSVLLWGAIFYFVPSYNRQAWRPVHELAEATRGKPLVMLQVDPSNPSVEFYHRAPFHDFQNLSDLHALQKSSKGSLYVIVRTEKRPLLEGMKTRLVDSKGNLTLFEVLP